MPKTNSKPTPRDYDVVSRDIADLIAKQTRIIGVRLGGGEDAEEWASVPHRLSKAAPRCSGWRKSFTRPHIGFRLGARYPAEQERYGPLLGTSGRRAHLPRFLTGPTGEGTGG